MEALVCTGSCCSPAAVMAWSYMSTINSKKRLRKLNLRFMAAGGRVWVSNWKHSTSYVSVWCSSTNFYSETEWWHSAETPSHTRVCFLLFKVWWNTVYKISMKYFFIILVMAQYLSCYRNSERHVNVQRVPLVSSSRRLKVNICISVTISPNSPYLKECTRVGILILATLL